MISISDAHSGILWSAVSRIIIHVFQFVTLIILAHILEPKEFGLITASLVVIGFLSVFRDLGISSAIIQRTELNDHLVNSVYWVVIIIGIIMNLALFFSAHQIAVFYNAYELTSILKVMSFSFTITSISIIHQALLEKQLKFKQLAFYEMIAVISGSLCAITLAFLNFGIWSLVIQGLVNASVISIILWLKSPFKPKLVFSLSEIKSIFKFSINLSGFNIVNYFVRNADYVLIQKYLGEQQLGFYNIAYRIMLYPLQNITAVFSRVMFPIYSTLQSDHNRIREMFLSLTNNIALLSFPLMLFVTASADVLVPSLLGEKWSSSIPLLLILAPIGMIQSVYTPAGTIFQAKGRTDLWFKWGLFTGIIFVTSFIIGLKWGIRGVAAGYLISNIITIYPGLYISLKLIDLPVENFVVSFKKTFLISVCMFFLIYCIKLFLSNYLTHTYLLLVLILLSLLYYIPISLKFNRQNVDDFLKIIKVGM